MKIIEKAKLDDQSRQLLSTEVACMERLLHPNIIRLFEVIETYPKLHLVMEIAAEGCLMDRLVEVGKFSEGEARDIITQVVSAVGHMVSGALNCPGGSNTYWCYNHCEMI